MINTPNRKNENTSRVKGHTSEPHSKGFSEEGLCELVISGSPPESKRALSGQQVQRDVRTGMEEQSTVTSSSSEEGQNRGARPLWRGTMPRLDHTPGLHTAPAQAQNLTSPSTLLLSTLYRRLLCHAAWLLTLYKSISTEGMRASRDSSREMTKLLLCLRR